MSHVMTAGEELFQDLKAMPTTERSKFFMLLANTIFQEENYTHDQVFATRDLKAFKRARAARDPG